MPTERLSMRDVREILRQKWQLGRSHRQVADSVGRERRRRGRDDAAGEGGRRDDWAEIEGADARARWRRGCTRRRRRRRSRRPTARGSTASGGASA